MSHRPRRTVQWFLALPAAVLAMIVGALLSAAPVFAQLPPPEPASPSEVHNMSTSAGTSGAALWTYLFVAGVALLIGAAVTYGLMRSQKSRDLITLDPKSTVPA